jgi:predicted DNA-binding transcriptional regulator YafY
VLDALGAALLARRRATFRYHSMERDEVAERTVEPWGLFFLGAHWYLAARDAAAGEGRAGLRNFRVSRVADVRVHAAGDGPEVVVPADFRLREHAQSRQAWELGDGDAELVLVAFRGETGVVRAARTLGQAVPADDPEAALAPAGTTLRRFRVRRREAFARWLLSFGGAARPLAPAAHVQGWRELARAARARYPEVPRGGTADDTLAALAPEPAR